MKIDFLAHSGFLIELPHVLLLFDWWKGELPPLTGGKPLVVFASHSHRDHFKPEIFALDDGSREVRFLLGKDIRLNPHRVEQWGISEETLALCTRTGGFQHKEPLPGVEVETLPSTDAGVAFLVHADGKTIYHAGDLNWWYWAGESKEWNDAMERDYKQYLEPLRGRHIDLAMVPLDSRLESGEDLGLSYFLGLTQTDHVLPMHQWEDYAPTDRFLQKYPRWEKLICPISHEGQAFIID